MTDAAKPKYDVMSDRQDHKTTFHPKSPDGLERFRRAAGSITLKGPVPSHIFLDEDEENQDSLDDCAGD